MSFLKGVTQALAPLAPIASLIPGAQPFVAGFEALNAMDGGTSGGGGGGQAQPAGGGGGGAPGVQPQNPLLTLAGALGPYAAQQIASGNQALAKNLMNEAAVGTQNNLNAGQANLNSIYNQYKDPATAGGVTAPQVTPQTLGSVYGSSPGMVPQPQQPQMPPYMAAIAQMLQGLMGGAGGMGGTGGGAPSPSFAVKPPTSLSPAPAAPAAPAPAPAATTPQMTASAPLAAPAVRAVLGDSQNGGVFGPGGPFGGDPNAASNNLALANAWSPG